MNESFTIDGLWWLPATPELKIPGNLSYKPGHTPRLKLMGTLNKPEKFLVMHSDFFNPPLIHGVSSKGEFITLNRCLQINGNNVIGDAGHQTTSEFIAYIVFFDTHFHDPDDIRFLSINVRLHELDNWFNKSCIKINSLENKQEEVLLDLPDPIITNLEEFEVKLGVTGKRNYRLNSASIQANAYLEIIGKNNKPIDEFLTLVRLIQNFFTLLISDPTFVTEMTGKLVVYAEVPNNNSSTQIIRIYYPAAGWQAEVRDVFWASMLLPLSEIEEDFPELLTLWVQKVQILKPVYDLFFAGIYKSTYPENEFLNLCQAIETYHRRIFGGEFLPEKTFLDGLYKTLVAAITPDIEPDFRSSLKDGKLRYAFEYSLRKRIELLCQHITENININFLKNHQDIVNYAKKITDTRNYLTHYTNDLKERSISGGKDLSEANNQLKLIMSICFLEQLGLPFNKIQERLSNHWSFKEYFVLH